MWIVQKWLFDHVKKRFRGPKSKLFHVTFGLINTNMIWHVLMRFTKHRKCQINLEINLLKRVFKNLEVKGLDMWRIGPKPIYKFYQKILSAWTKTIGFFKFRKKIGTRIEGSLKKWKLTNTSQNSKTQKLIKQRFFFRFVIKPWCNIELTWIDTKMTPT
jgi:hypothetical protein